MSSTTLPLSAITIPAAGTPASRASWACAASIRYSPWIGITARGLTSESIVRSSSEQAWPETCTGRDLLVQHLGAGAREPVDRVVDA